MKILLLSDTHGFIDEKILRHCREADAIWHAGDIGPGVLDTMRSIRPVRAVYGNIDDAKLRREIPQDLHFAEDGVRVFMTHIGGYPGHYNPRVKKILQADPPALCICGHSHILKIMQDPSMGFLFINPGAAGVQGFHSMRTMVRFETGGGKLHSLEVIELGKRGRLSTLV